MDIYTIPTEVPTIAEKQEKLFVAENNNSKFISPFRDGILGQTEGIGNGFENYKSVFVGNNAMYNYLKLSTIDNNQGHLCLPKLDPKSFPWAGTVTAANWKLGIDGTGRITYLNLDQIIDSKKDTLDIYPATNNVYTPLKNQDAPWADDIYYKNVYQIKFLNTFKDILWSKGSSFKYTSLQEGVDFTQLKNAWKDTHDTIHMGHNNIYKIKNNKIYWGELDYDVRILYNFYRTSPGDGWDTSERITILIWIYNVKCKWTEKFTNNNSIFTIGLQGQGGCGGINGTYNGSGGGGGGFIGGVIDATNHTWYVFGGARDRFQNHNGGDKTTTALSPNSHMYLNEDEHERDTGVPMTCVNFNTTNTADEELSLAYCLYQAHYPYLGCGYYTDNSIAQEGIHYVKKPDILINLVKRISEHYLIANGGEGGVHHGRGGNGGQSIYSNSTNKPFWVTTQVNGGKGANAQSSDNGAPVGSWAFKFYAPETVQSKTIPAELNYFTYPIDKHDGGTSYNAKTGGGGASPLGPGGSGGGNYQNGQEPDDGYGGGGGGARYHFMNWHQGGYGATGCMLIFH